MTPLPDLHWALLNVDENFVFVVNQHGELIDRIEWPRGPMSNIALVGDNTVVIRALDKLYFYDVKFHQGH
jgi:sugar lactone lactonase YvrE